jgi:hypothetical protein
MAQKIGVYSLKFRHVKKFRPGTLADVKTHSTTVPTAVFLRRFLGVLS